MSFLVAGERLKRALERSAEIAGCSVRVTEEVHKPWDAAMFEGGLHEVTFAIGGADGGWWLESMDEFAIFVPGFVLSKLEVTTVETVKGQLMGTIEAETVKEA